MSKPIPSVVVSFLAGVLGALLVLYVSDARPNVQNALELNGGSLSNLVQDSGDTHEDAIVRTVETTSPAVVSVVLTRDVPIFEQSFETLPDQNPFDPFGISPFQFRVPQLEQRGTERREVGGGSGFIVSPDGMIVTNRHVVDEDDVDYTVFTSDGESYPATVTARDSVLDLAVLQIEADGLPYLDFADSDQLKVGQSVIAIGNALAEFQNSVSVGVISGLSRSVVAGNGLGDSELLDEVLQTDAAINPGNSGGPLLDLQGNVVGVNVAVALGSENIGFAIPSNAVSSIVTQVMETGSIARPFLGVRYRQITPALAEQNNLDYDYGVLVMRGDNPEELAVSPGSPADRAGIEENDIILEIDGVRLDENTSLANEVRRKNIGEQTQLLIVHEGEERTVTATLERFEE